MVRQRPQDFNDIGQEVLGGWMIDGAVWEENPLHAIPPLILTIVDLWMDCRMRQGPDVSRPLPAAGGLADQVAPLMDAFGILDAKLIEQTKGAGDAG